MSYLSLLCICPFVRFIFNVVTCFINNKNKIKCMTLYLKNIMNSTIVVGCVSFNFFRILCLNISNENIICYVYLQFIN